MSDDLFQISQLKKQFYSVDIERLDFILRNSSFFPYASIILRMEARDDTYERTVLSVFDFTGLIGGVFEILEVTGSIVVGFFAYKLSIFLMISNLYQIQLKYTEPKNEDKTNLNLKKYGMIKRKIRDNVKMKEESKNQRGKMLFFEEIDINMINHIAWL